MIYQTRPTGDSPEAGEKAGWSEPIVTRPARIHL